MGRGGGGAAGRAEARGLGSGGAGGGAAAGGPAGRWVPQYPQNLLPWGNDLWHFGHKTWGAAGPPGLR